MDRRLPVPFALILTLCLGAPAHAEAEAAGPAPPFRAFTADSFWNTPLPPDAPVRKKTRRIVKYLRKTNTPDHVVLSGTDESGDWGQPVYWAATDDPEYRVRSRLYNLPQQLRHLRIPRGARPDGTSDGEMTVYDLDRGYVASLWNARFRHGVWSAGGGDVYYLGSNGLDGSLKGSNEPRNGGAHRGLPAPTYAVRLDEILAGRIDHVLKIAVNTTRTGRHVFPMVGHEDGARNRFAPVEGSRIRIKPGVDLGGLELSPAALVIAQALQTYGAVIGDQSGGNVELKLENTVAEGRGQLWDGVLDVASLANIPISRFQVIRYGYRP